MLQQDQVDLLVSRWGQLEEGDFSHPLLRNLREHTRIVLAKAAQEGGA